MLRRSSVAIAIVALAVGMVGCGSDSDPSASGLTGPAADGEALAKRSGCAACHGLTFGGGTGPSLRGLLGRQITLDNGTTLTADEAYITRAITDPQAEQVKGFALKMPENTLTADQVAGLVAFITSLKG